MFCWRSLASTRQDSFSNWGTCRFLGGQGGERGAADRSGRPQQSSPAVFGKSSRIYDNAPRPRASPPSSAFHSCTSPSPFLLVPNDQNMSSLLDLKRGGPRGDKKFKRNTSNHSQLFSLGKGNEFWEKHHAKLWKFYKNKFSYRNFRVKKVTGR